MSSMVGTHHSPSQRWSKIATIAAGWLSQLAFWAPIVIFILNAISILIYLVDIPSLDDWEPLYHGTAGSFRLRALFARGNDSIFPVGRALDALAQQTLLGNSIAYQFITMVCLLGGILLLQWKMLSHIINDHIVRRCAFSLCTLSMVEYTYWGQQNNAYIQGVPILCMLAIVYVVVCLSVRKELIYFMVGLLSAVAGMTYVSGAIGFIPLGCTMLLFGRMRGAERLRGAGVTVISMSVVCTAIQLSFVFAYQGAALHRPDAFITLPNNPDYWYFLLGKVGRSLGILPPVSWPSLAIALIASGVLGALCLRGLGAVRRPGTLDAGLWSSFILCSLTSASLLVMSMIAAGRANLARPDSFAGPLGVFEFGFMNRFHFFWFTVVWPWMLLCALLAWVGNAGLRRAIAICLSLFWLSAAGAGGAFDNAQDYRASEPTRRSQISCLQEKLSAGKGLLCPSVFPVDLSYAFVLASNLHASFTRYLQITPKPIGSGTAPILFRLSDTPQALQFQNARLTQMKQGDWTFESSEDPQLIFNVDDHRLDKCLAVQVSARVKASHPATAQLFYTSANKPFFTAERSQAVPLAADGSHWFDVDFVVPGLNFGSKFRLDPTYEAQTFEVGEIEVSCRMEPPGPP